MSEYFNKDNDESGTLEYLDVCPDCQKNFLQYSIRTEDRCVEINEEESQAAIECGDCGFAADLVLNDAEVTVFDALQFRAEKSIKSDIKTFENLDALGEQRSAIRLGELLVEEGFLPPLEPRA